MRFAVASNAMVTSNAMSMVVASRVSPVTGVRWASRRISDKFPATFGLAVSSEIDVTKPRH